MELRRKAEEAERLRQAEADKLIAQKLQEEFEQAAKDERNNRERFCITILTVKTMFLLKFLKIIIF